MEILKLTQVVKRDETVEIPVPSFYVSKDEKSWVGILDVNTVVTIYCTDDLKIVKNTIPAYASSDLIDAATSYHSCTESAFLEKYDQMIESISLHPILKA